MTRKCLICIEQGVRLKTLAVIGQRTGVSVLASVLQ